jgi:predicted enzyme related to lactoylglutathione lyase
MVDGRRDLGVGLVVANLFRRASDVTQASAATATPTYAPGTPTWVDLTAKDLAGTVRFYEQLFGWKGEDQGEEAGHYTLMRSNGKMVAAITPPMDPNMPPVWSTYIATQNAEETAKKVEAAGGKTLMAPFQVMDQGTMAAFMDPTGAAFCVWQPAAMKGAEMVNQPGSFSWNELATRDMNAAKSFYSKVFGWTPKGNPMPDGSEYVEWQLDGKSIGGGMTMGSMFPPDVPPHWLVYFTVNNTDDTVKRAQEMDGRVLAPAMDIPQGRFAVLANPEGAPFAVIQMPKQ